MRFCFRVGAINVGEKHRMWLYYFSKNCYIAVYSYIIEPTLRLVWFEIAWSLPSLKRATRPIEASCLVRSLKFSPARDIAKITQFHEKHSVDHSRERSSEGACERGVCRKRIF